MVPAPSSLRERLERWLRERADDDVLRWLFGAMLVATVGVLGLDYVVLNSRGGEPAWESPAASPASTPSAQPLPPSKRAGETGRPAPLRRPDAQLQGKMTFDLAADGRLLAIGTIVPGSAKAFAAEVEKRGSYVKTVVLHSPGGSLNDALAMGRLIREKKFATEIESGSYCSSACPLVFAGGVERRAGPKAAIGVHRVITVSNGPLPEFDGMEDGQRISAQCQKYLRDMGIDLAVWIHAMETPNDELYYFKADELLSLKLATQAGADNKRAAAR
jgi:hypothetical protein